MMSLNLSEIDQEAQRYIFFQFFKIITRGDDRFFLIVLTIFSQDPLENTYKLIHE